MAVLSEARAQGITTPALFLTAKAEIEDRVTGLDAGADDYLPKPFDASETRLNNKEYQLMELFLRNPQQVFSSEHLIERI